MQIIKRWQWIIDSYDEWINAGHKMTPQLDLIKRLAESKYAKEFYPSTSMATLLISNFENYTDQLESPSISVTFFGKQTFEVTYSDNPSQTHKLEKHRCHQLEVFPLLESLFIRMKSIQNKTQQS